MTTVRLAAGREFDVIRLLQERWGRLAVGLGDDAASLVVPRGERLLVSTDAAIENVHFVRSWMPLRDVGYRAITAALSDLAAMAAQPLGVFVSLQLPSPFDDDQVAALGDGIGDAVGEVDTVIRGGNIAAGDGLAITTTVLGSAFAPLHRTGARVGDHLYLTGALGGPRAAINARTGGREAPPAHWERFAHPRARVREALWLARHGATAAIDISDGLAGDASHLSAASGVAIAIDLDRVPLMEGVQPDDVFGGEEYELLVASPAELPAGAFEAEFGTPLSRIGRVVDGPAEVRFTRGDRRVAAPGGYDHLSA